MEGSPDDIKASSEKKDDKKAKKSETAFGLGKSTFEFSKKKEIAEAPLWEKLIPKDGGDKVEKPNVEATETATAEAHEEQSDPTVETIAAEEMPEVIKEEASALLAERQAEAPAPEGTAEAVEQQASIEYLEQVTQNPEMISVDVATEAGGEVDDSEAAEQATEQPEDSPAEFEHGQEIPLNAPEQPDEAKDEPVQPTSAATTVPPPPPQVVSTPGSAGIPGNQPPTPPGPNFNTIPTPAVNPNTAPTATRIEYVRDTRSEGAYFLAGGILGYLLGRRRGRIKTEKRMNVVKQKLEKQIDQVRQEVVRQETVIRQQAREQYNLTHAQSQERAAVPRGVETTAARTINPGQRAETVTQLTQTEVGANQRQAAERLGITQVEAAATAERIQRFDHREVLAIAEKVSIDGTSLRTIYESKQITEPGLRRITREFLRGGDVKAALQAEIQVKEMQYERDPQMRDRLAASYAGVDAAQPQASQEAMATLVAQATDPARTPMKGNTETNEAAVQAAKERGRKVLVSAWAVFVVVLVIVAVILAAR